MSSDLQSGLTASQELIYARLQENYRATVAATDATRNRCLAILGAATAITSFQLARVGDSPIAYLAFGACLAIAPLAFWQATKAAVPKGSMLPGKIDYEASRSYAGDTLANTYDQMLSDIVFAAEKEIQSNAADAKCVRCATFLLAIQIGLATISAAF